MHRRITCKVSNQYTCRLQFISLFLCLWFLLISLRKALFSHKFSIIILSKECREVSRMELCRNSCKLAQHESHANSYKFRIYPTDEQIILIIKSFGCARWVYNHFLNECAASISAGVSRPTYYDCHSKLTELKKATDTVWLAEPDKFAVENALKDLDAAFRNHFRNPLHFKYPVRKSKKNPKQSYRTNYFKTKSGGNIEIDESGGRIKLPKLGWVKTSISRHVEGRLLNVTVSRNA